MENKKSRKFCENTGVDDKQKRREFCKNTGVNDKQEAENFVKISVRMINRAV